MAEAINDARYEVVEEISPESNGDDQVAWWLKVVIMLVIVTALVAALYGLMTGVIRPSSPRTAAEAKLITLESVVKTTPESGKAWRDYIAALSATGQKDKAWNQVKLARAKVKGLDRSYPNLAELDLLWADKDYEQVLKKSAVAIKLENGYRNEYIKAREREGRRINDLDIPVQVPVDILLYQARASGALKDWDAAVKSLTAALKRDPNASDLLVLRAQAYEELEKWDKARADYKQALRFIPDMEPALQGLERVENK